MKYEIEIDTDDFAEQIVIQELTWHLKHTQPNQKPPMFSYEPEEDAKKVRKLRQAFKRVLEYYGVKK